MTEKGNANDARTFVLRLWAEDAGGRRRRRFSLEDPVTRARRGFASLRELGRYLADLGAAGRAPRRRREERSRPAGGRRSAGVLVLALTVLMALSSFPALALDPPPACSDALWWGTWATARISPKTINDGDTVTITLSIVGGPPEGTYCNTGSWTKTGTGAVDIRVPGSCFELLDYTPKADALRDVTVDAGGVHWRAKTAGPAPSTESGPMCYCRWNGVGTSSDTRGCATDFWKGGQFSPGDTLTVKLRAKCSRVDAYWSRSELAWLAGHWGLNWSYGAEDYYKLGGHMAVSLAAAPSAVPADGSASSLTATVTESASGVKLPRTEVAFDSSLGILTAPPIVTDGEGEAKALLFSPGAEGTATVTASVPGAQGQAQVTFTHVDNPPSPWDNSLGPYQQVAAVGDPVHAGIGNYFFSRRLFGFPGKGLPFDFEVVYNSRDNLANGPLGFGWTHSWNVVLTPSGNDVSIRWGDGRVDRFTGDGAGGFAQNASRTLVKVTKPDASRYVATLHDGVAYEFDAAGRLQSVADPNGNRITVAWSSASPGLVDHLTDTAGRTISLTHDAAGRVTAIASPLKTGSTVSFLYDANGDLAGIVDPRGKTWAFAYDGSHRVATVVDAKGATTLTNTYDSSGRVARQVDGGGNALAYAYVTDAAGTTTTITPPSGNAVVHRYDPAGNVAAMTDGEGRSASFRTNALGQFVGVTAKAGGVSQTAFDASGNPSVSRDPSGGVSRFGFDARNRPTYATNPLGQTTSFGWDAAGNVTRVQNPLGDAMGISYDASGLPTSLSDFGGGTWGVSWEATGLPQALTAPDGSRTVLVYDAAGRLTEVQRPAPGGTTRLAYDEAGHVVSVTDPLGSVTTRSFDDDGNLAAETFVPTGATTSITRDWAGRPTRVVDSLGGVSSTVYGPDGTVASTADPDGVVTTYEHDRSNRLTAFVDALGHRTRLGYDADGRVTSVTDALGSTWTTAYDVSGRPVRVADPLGNATTTAYDAAGRPTSVTDPLGNVVASRLDAAGQVASTTLPDQGVVTFTRDRNGRPLAVTDPLGNAWSFTWDASGRLVGARDPSGKSESRSYDAPGRLASRTLRDGSVVTYAWDAADRLTSRTAGGQATSLAYDAAGNVVSTTDSSGTSTMTYDLLGRRLSKTDPSGKTIAFTWTPAGRLRTVTYPGGLVVTRSYDAAGRLAGLADSRGNATTFLYDAANRLTQVNLPNGTRTLYGYDAAGRVTSRSSRTASGTVIAGYADTFDAAGRIGASTRTEPAAPSFADSNASFTYDPVDRVLASSADGVLTRWTFDARGNATTRSSAAGTTAWTWDGLGRLAAATDASGTTTYAYDGAGNRLSRTDAGGTTRWLRDGTTVWATLDGGGNPTESHVWAGALLYSLDAAGAIRVYHADERGSVVAVTDAAQDVVQSYSYDPYGRVVGSAGGLDNPFRFVGTHGVLTDANGLVQMQDRYYDPDARRFLSEDPLGLSAGLNLYAYADGDPVGRIDPEGRESAEEVMARLEVENPDMYGAVRSIDPETDWTRWDVWQGRYEWLTGKDEKLGDFLWSLGLKLGYNAVTKGELPSGPFLSRGAHWTGLDDPAYEAVKAGLRRLGCVAEEKAVVATGVERTFENRGVPTVTKVGVGAFLLLEFCDAPATVVDTLQTTTKGIGSLIRGTGMFLKAVWNGLPAGAPPPDWKTGCLKSLDCTAYGDGLISKQRPPA